MANSPVGTLGSTSCFAITPDDDNDLTHPIRAIYVGVGGDVKVLLWDDTVPVVFKAMASGAIYPMQVKRLYDADTDATDIVGLL